MLLLAAVSFALGAKAMTQEEAAECAQLMTDAMTPTEECKNNVPDGGQSGFDVFCDPTTAKCTARVVGAFTTFVDGECGQHMKDAGMDMSDSSAMFDEYIEMMKESDIMCLKNEDGKTCMNEIATFDDDTTCEEYEAVKCCAPTVLKYLESCENAYIANALFGEVGEEPPTKEEIAESVKQLKDGVVAQCPDLDLSTYCEGVTDVCSGYETESMKEVNAILEGGNSGALSLKAAGVLAMGVAALITIF